MISIPSSDSRFDILSGTGTGTGYELTEQVATEISFFDDESHYEACRYEGRPFLSKISTERLVRLFKTEYSQGIALKNSLAAHLAILVLVRERGANWLRSVDRELVFVDFLKSHAIAPSDSELPKLGYAAGSEIMREFAEYENGSGNGLFAAIEQIIGKRLLSPEDPCLSRRVSESINLPALYGKTRVVPHGVEIRSTENPSVLKVSSPDEIKYVIFDDTRNEFMDAFSYERIVKKSEFVRLLGSGAEGRVFQRRNPTSGIAIKERTYQNSSFIVNVVPNLQEANRFFCAVESAGLRGCLKAPLMLMSDCSRYAMDMVHGETLDSLAQSPGRMKEMGFSKEKINLLFDDLQNAISRFPFEHGDLNARNVIYDEKYKRLAIIDLDNARIARNWADDARFVESVASSLENIRFKVEKAYALGKECRPMQTTPIFVPKVVRTETSFPASKSTVPSSHLDEQRTLRDFPLENKKNAPTTESVVELDEDLLFSEMFGSRLLPK